LFDEDEETLLSSTFIGCSTVMEDEGGVVKAEELGAIRTEEASSVREFGGGKKRVSEVFRSSRRGAVAAEGWESSCTVSEFWIIVQGNSAMGCVSVFGGFGIGIKTKSTETILKLTSSRPGTSIIASSSSGTSDKGDESLSNNSGDTDRDTIETEKLTGDSGGDEGGKGDEGVSTSTSKLLSRSLLSEGNVCSDSTSSSIKAVIGSIGMEIRTSRDVVSSVI
jgi:hypothetical protein